MDVREAARVLKMLEITAQSCFGGDDGQSRQSNKQV
ncbi:hypothetical protein RO3G_09160 [Rhizopus delemar RA 99-880]|uniref:Uncharacterized protein n=1 Tax=Rhizopus delemar (strain RA 99-880 / ATCC MYA-4621 / FGSC 9543 / NRRL 43880) TaxID=246409 RepID=I1C7M0_RHIO9|nr:hypothetical protein RO3G_09160 [Rhizopus delemar RA 99-880]|eukprot:EIE84450.1 hypothetical protein RO3G_09160 [Rhizopus delemar RA 99-880]